VLRAVKIWPGKGTGRGKVGATDNLDGSWRPSAFAILRRTKKRNCRSYKETDQESKKEIAALKALDNRKPIQAQAAPTVRLKVPKRRSLVVATKWDNAHGARGMGHRR
jgi:hypothetical protein